MFSKSIWLIFAVILMWLDPAFSQDTTKVYHATRIEKSPVIDGELNEPFWQTIPAMTDFFQYQPNEGTKPDHPTEVRIAYDDRAIYIGALMIDSAPDSVLG